VTVSFSATINGRLPDKARAWRATIYRFLSRSSPRKGNPQNRLNTVRKEGQYKTRGFGRDKGASKEKNNNEEW
jgi:hypothetical protein